jgi:hypothetical protein
MRILHDHKRRYDGGIRNIIIIATINRSCFEAIILGLVAFCYQLLHHRIKEHHLHKKVQLFSLLHIGERSIQPL